MYNFKLADNAEMWKMQKEFFFKAQDLGGGGCFCCLKPSIIILRDKQAHTSWNTVS